ncbi:MAG: glycosyltransferase [Phycisphaerae bacterium]
MSEEEVSLVIPARDCAATIGPCLSAVTPLLEASSLAEIIVVDDASTDRTAGIVADFPVTCVAGRGEGPGAARNLGWRLARSPLVWFVDSDCVAEDNALALLLSHMKDPMVGAVGGSYGIMTRDSLLARLIHEEIIQRHLRMSHRVDFLASFNVLYRRAILEHLGGFDQRYLKGQDAELSWRVLRAGYQLAFEVNSRVRHYHPVALWDYLATQQQQGYWRVWMYMAHRSRARGDAYSSLIDHVQPPVALSALASLPLLLFTNARWVPMALIMLLAAAQVPMTLRLVKRKRQVAYVMYAGLSFVRVFWRAAGMTAALFSAACGRSPLKPTNPRSGG